MTEDEVVSCPELYDLAERYLHLAVESMLDIANHLIVDFGLTTPEINQGSFTVLERESDLPEDLASRLRSWAGFRNILVHQYLDIDHRISWQVIQNELSDLEQFCHWVLEN